MTRHIRFDMSFKRGPGHPPGPRQIPTGYVSVHELATEAGVSAQAIRVRLRNAGIQRRDKRWMWRSHSLALQKARKLIGLNGSVRHGDERNSDQFDAQNEAYSD